jgi:hypothetical protein
MEPFNNLLGRNRLWGSLGRTQRKILRAGSEPAHDNGRVLTSTQRRAPELIRPCPSPTTETWLLSFNRMQFRIVTGLLAGHKTLRRHLYIMGLNDSPLCRRNGAERGTSAHVLCQCEPLTTLRHTYLGSFFLG